MSPTVFRHKSYRFFFFSREETRLHIHVSGLEGEAKFWLAPKIELTQNYGFSLKQLKLIQKIIEDHKDEISKAWQKHFNR